MATLGDGKSITTVEDKEVVLTSSTGEQFKMKATDLAEAIRQIMPEVNRSKKGLMSPSFFRLIKKDTQEIAANGVCDTGIDSGCLLIVRNANRSHDLAMALLFRNGGFKVLASSGFFSFSPDSQSPYVCRDTNSGLVLVKNDTAMSQTVEYIAIIME